MYSYEQVQAMLEELVDTVPLAILGGLNGGIILSADSKKHPQDLADNLYILGEYCRDPLGMGQYIIIYYGSVMTSYGHLAEAALKEELRKILYHELTHHLEYQAGDQSLEMQDMRDLIEYRRMFED